MTQEPARRKALITGASSGIGEAFARRLARDGYDLILVARRKDRLDKLAGELSAKEKTGAEIIVADLASPDGLSQIESRLGGGDIDLLVNNAGFGTRGEFASLPLERETEEIDLNVRALVRLTHAALEPMSKRGSGGIINIASTGAFQPVPHMATYAATKAFVLHFTEAVYEEAKRHGVKVTCLCPGGVRTEFQQVAGVDASRMPSMSWLPVEKVVQSGLSALEGGRAVAVPGVVNNATSTFARFAPRFLVRRVAGRIFRD